MKVARLIDFKKFEFSNSDIVEPNVGECLLKVKVVSVCGTDIRREFNKKWNNESYPQINGLPCHEVVGEIYRSKSKFFKEGDRVLAVPTSDNGLQEYLTLSEDRFIHLPDYGDYEDWVMCQHSGTVLYASKKWGNPVGKNIAILGQGGIGLSFTMIASMQGAKSIICVDYNQFRLDFSKKFGSTHVINASNENILEKISEITNGQMADIVVEASGSSSGLNDSIEVVRKKGKIILFGLTQDDLIPFNQNNFLSKNCIIESTLIAGTETPLKEIKEMIEMKKRGLLDPGKLKTHVMDWENVQEAFDMYDKNSEGLIKIALKVS